MGGLDISAHVAGLNIALATDRDEEALRVLRSGLGTSTLGFDVESRSISDLLSAVPDCDIVIGGPPCTAFSHAGFWMKKKRNGEDPATAQLDDFLDVVREIQPRAFVLENVPGLLFKTHSRFFERLVNRARRAGYWLSWKVLNASDFGVAQARRRLFVVGIKNGRHFEFPSPTWPRRSSSWAIGDLADRPEFAEDNEYPRGRWADLLTEVPPGGNYLYFTARFGYNPPIFKYRGRYWSFLLKLDPDSPAPTIPAQRVTFNGPFHWKSRHLRLREMARLQSMPDWMPLHENATTARRHIGNAVPVALGAILLWSLRMQLGDASESDQPAMFKTLSDPSSSVQDVIDSIPQPALRLRIAA